MSLHWTLIAGFLYAEITAVILLLLPFIPNRRWNQLFKSRFLKGIENQFIYYFYILVAILVLFFLGKNFPCKKSDSFVYKFHFRRHPWDAKVWWRRKTWRRTSNTFGCSDADAYETFSSPTELLYLWIRSFPLPVSEKWLVFKAHTNNHWFQCH